MRTIDTLRRSAVAVKPGATIRHAAQLMEQATVGSLAVVEGERLVGIVTDRDLVRRAMARGMSADARIDSVMSTPVVTIQANADVQDAFALFRTNAVRRLAVLEGERFIGIISVDDLLMAVAANLSDLAKPVTAEVLFGHRDSPVPAALG